METHFSFVNNWECDENDHWNVQFYFRAFQLAAEVLAVRSGRPNPGTRTALCQHVRFHLELIAGESVKVVSARLADGALAGCIVHRLQCAETEELCATCIDHAGYRCGEMETIKSDKVLAALPRGVMPGPTLAVDSGPLLKSKRAVISMQDIVRPFDLDHDGELIADRIISRFTDSAAHIWRHAGISGSWLAKENLGRVAVELKLTRLASVPCGAAVQLVSWAERSEGRAFAIRHQMEDIATGEAIAAGEIRCLLLDLKSRRSVDLPEWFLASTMDGPL